VLGLIGSERRLYPVGRLDLESEGLMLLTNDGELANRLTHPRYEHPKEYRVLLDRQPESEELRRWREGVRLPDGVLSSPCVVELESKAQAQPWLRVVLTQGRKRQIRDTAGALGLRVRRLIRTRLAGLELGKLPVGQWRELRPEEIARLRRATGLLAASGEAITPPREKQGG
jgi:23S rRNA pseudouridine2605 synthase